MRLQPIEKPPGLLMRVAYWAMRRQFGKVMTPVKVVIARMPQALRMTYAITRFELHGIRLDPTIHFLVGALTAQINGCSFCEDLGRAMAMREQLGINAAENYYNLLNLPVEIGSDGFCAMAETRAARRPRRR